VKKKNKPWSTSYPAMGSTSHLMLVEKAINTQKPWLPQMLATPDYY
jgi:hypothetical protein